MRSLRKYAHKPRGPVPYPHTNFQLDTSKHDETHSRTYILPYIHTYRLYDFSSTDISSLFFINLIDMFGSGMLKAILPFYNASAPARLRMPVPHVSTKPLKSSPSLQAKVLFLHLKQVNKVLQQVLSWSTLIYVTCKLLMSVYLDIKSLYSHLKVNWNVLMCKICIARRLVVDIFPWCNANSVPFPSGTLVARQIGNGRIGWKQELKSITYAINDGYLYLEHW